MNTANHHVQPSNAFVEHTLTTVNHLLGIAQDITDALGLPEDARYAVLSGLVFPFLEELCNNEQNLEEIRASAGIEDILPGSHSRNVERI